MGAEHVYVVTGETGQYEDHVQWNVVAFDTRPPADDLCDVLNKDPTIDLMSPRHRDDGLLYRVALVPLGELHEARCNCRDHVEGYLRGWLDDVREEAAKTPDRPTGEIPAWLQCSMRITYGLLRPGAAGSLRRYGFFDDNEGVYLEGAEDGCAVLWRKAGKNTQLAGARWGDDPPAALARAIEEALVEVRKWLT